MSGGPLGSTVVRGLQGRAVSAAAPASGQTLQWDGTSNQWEPGASATTLTGDANGPVGSTTVSALRGRTISAAAPLNGQVLRWDGTSNQWEPGGAAGNYAASFTAQTSLLIPGSAHGYQSSELLVECFDSTDKAVDPDSVSINATTYDVTVGFAQAQSGSCVVNGGSSGTSGGSGTGSGSISSVFGRTGRSRRRRAITVSRRWRER